MRAVPTPRVDPVGLVEHPEGYAAAPREYTATIRLTSAAVLGVFLVVGIATTVLSLGAYCLTSHASTPFVPWP